MNNLRFSGEKRNEVVSVIIPRKVESLGLQPTPGCPATMLNQNDDDDDLLRYFLGSLEQPFLENFIEAYPEPELRSYVVNQDGNEDSLQYEDTAVTEAGIEPETGKPAEQELANRVQAEEAQHDGNADFLPNEEVAAAAAGIEPEPGKPVEEELANRVPAEEALANRVEAVVYYFLHVQCMAVAEVIAILERGIKDDISTNPNTPLETKVHNERMKKKRPYGMKCTKKKKPGPSEEAQEVCHSEFCFDSHPYSVSQFVVFSSRRISSLKQPSAGRATMAEAETEEVPPWPLDPEQDKADKEGKPVGWE
jgi:hypothetical protein